MTQQVPSVLKTVASSKLDKEIQEELNKPDPSDEEATAILEKIKEKVLS